MLGDEYFVSHLSFLEIYCFASASTAPEISAIP
jgi:hypothetical protein